MKKVIFIILAFIFICLCYLTVVSAEKVLRTDWKIPSALEQNKTQYRLVLITQDMETPFWDEVGNGALVQADKLSVSMEVWGSYGNNQEDFLKKVELAIHSKVDGIIVQGLNTDEFKHLSKIKASFYGIPIVTIANDVPMDESLRRTYVGSDQYAAGKMIANELVADMGTSGKVVLMYDNREEYYQVQRLHGIHDVLKEYPDIEMIDAETTDMRDQVIATTQEVLNQSPDADAFIAVNANIVGAMLQEISKRFQIEPYYIYSFDDGPESLSLLTQGKLDAIIKQSPEEMGKKGVQLIVEWLDDETVPLEINGYYTDIDILRALEFHE
ncbi:sugar ABC transporter substrate-binding protein [Evansella cellulosilytica]|uniref:sugar ABC transporter substrate-binding protein n=1 Tax=Evansella cellulosilytica TaxID=1413 RepID=UPI00031F0895|nr:substrate-binding domain-containing protein [Evansella cellulosilytica]